MKAYKLEIFIIDHDNIGKKEIKLIIENQKYPNHCISPEVKSIESCDIGEWYDRHPLNLYETADSEYKKIFSK